jgi:archaeal chaperonin
LSTSSRRIAPTKRDDPAVIISDDKRMSRGKTAQRNNIAAARLISEIVRTSLGPRGMDKMVISEFGATVITNDGATMLKEMAVLHPAGKILVEVSKATDATVGDGTTSAVVLAGALLEKAEDLLKKKVHPVQIVSGFHRARDRALELLDAGAIRVGRDRDTLIAVARTSMQSKVVAKDAPALAAIVADAVLMVARESGRRYSVDMKSVKVEKKQGGSVADTALIRGIVLNQNLAHPDMPRRVTDARIAILTVPFDLQDHTLQKKVVIRDAALVKRFIDEEVVVVKGMVDKVRSTGANVLICQKPIDQVARQHLARSGIMAIEKAYEYELPKIARATGARIVNSIDDLSEADLGRAGTVEERQVQGGKLLFIEGCSDPRAVTILIRGGSQRVTEEAERSVHDALMVAKDVMEEPALVPGGGACEAELAYEVQKWSSGLEGREQLAAEKFAEALEQIPMTLAENAGMRRLTAAAQLRAKHAEGGSSFGISADGRVKDMVAEGVFEPLAVKRQVISSSTEAASMILRVDNTVTTKLAQRGQPRGVERPAEMDQPLPI